MRLRRLCETKKTGKSWVTKDIQEDYAKGGESREVLELALLETLRNMDDLTNHQRIRAGFLQVCVWQYSCK